MYLMIHFCKLGPSSLHTGRYHFEQQGGALPAQPLQSVQDPA